MKTVILVATGGLLVLTISCGTKFVPSDYFPLKKGNSRIFSGPMGHVVVTEQVEMGDSLQYILSFGDTLGNVAWQEKYVLIQGRVYWFEFAPKIPFLPEITFEPPIEISPISGRVGFKKIVDVIESRKDSANTAWRLQIEYEIESIEQVVVAASTFPNCIRMRISLAYHDPTDAPLMEGGNTYWFAKGVGIVKYVLPPGSGELLRTEPP